MIMMIVFVFVTHLAVTLFCDTQSGGMPDDTTVIAIHVTGFAADDQMDHPNM